LYATVHGHRPRFDDELPALKVQVLFPEFELHRRETYAGSAEERCSSCWVSSVFQAQLDTTLTLSLTSIRFLPLSAQLSACIVYLTSKWSYTMAFVLINILGYGLFHFHLQDVQPFLTLASFPSSRSSSKLYTITALLAISTPLNAQSEASLQTPGAQHANMLSSNDPTCSGPSLPEPRTGSLVERVEKVWRMGSSKRGGRSRETTGGSGVKVNGGMNDEERGISFDEMFDQKTGFSTKVSSLFLFLSLSLFSSIRKAS
jgi:hypothetical protein